MSNPVKFEISILVELNDEGVLHTLTKLFVNSQQIGWVNRLRVDQDFNEVLPSIQVDMLRGVDKDMMDPKIRESAQKDFELLKLVPGMKCVMPAPRI